VGASDTSLIFNLVSKEKVGEGLKSAREKFDTAAEGIAATMGIGLAEGIASSLDVSAANAKLAAQLGANSSKAAELGKMAGDVYASGWGDSMESVDEAIRGAFTNVPGITDAMAKDVSQKALAIATTFDSTAGEIESAVGTMLKTGMAGSADQAFDLITAANQQFGGEAGEILDLLGEYSTQFRKIGLDGQTSLGLVNQMLAAGAPSADVAADALKEFAIRAIDGSATTVAAYQSMGFNAQDMMHKIASGGPVARDAMQQVFDKLSAIQDPVEKNTVGTELLGTQWEDLGGAINGINFSTAAASLGDVDGKTQQMMNTLATSPAQTMETFKREVTTKLTEVGAGIVSFGAQHQAALMPIASILGGIALAVVGVSAAMKVWEAATQLWSVAQKIATGVQWAFNAAMDANPIALVVLAVVGLVAAIVLLYQNSDTARAIIQAAFGVILAVAMAPYDWVTANWPILLSILIWPFQEGQRLIDAAFALAWAVIRAPYDWTTANWPLLLSILIFPFQEGERLIGAAWSGIVSGGEAVSGWISGLPAKIQGALSSVGGIVYAPFKWAFNAVANGWNQSVGRVGFSIPSWVPGLGGKSWSIPDVPLLDVGGSVTRTGLAVIHQGETVLPAGTTPLPSMLSGPAGGGTGEPAVLELRSSGQRIDDLLLEILRTAIANRGGNVQTVLGR
jgi:hypothetical protein